MNKIVIVFLLFIIFRPAIYCQVNYGPVDTLQFPNGCYLTIPESCDPHDYWFFKTDCELDSFKLKVYNRWGQQVFNAGSFDKNGYALAKGNSNTVLPNGTYYWVISIMFRHETEWIKPVSGTVEIKQIMK